MVIACKMYDPILNVHELTGSMMGGLQFGIV